VQRNTGRSVKLYLGGNTFGALHNCGDNDWPGPEIWYTKDSEWCYEYNVKETGILKSPVIRMLEEKKI
jgi:hypothetical protein